MNVIVHHCTVDDVYDTPLEAAFEGVPGDTLVVQAYDDDSGALVALARNDEQPIADLEREARFQLALCVARTARQNEPAGDATDPRS